VTAGHVSHVIRSAAITSMTAAVVQWMPAGCSVDEEDAVRAWPIGSEALLLGVAADDPLAGRSRVRLNDLADRDFVEYRSDSSLRASIDRACQAVGLHRRVACEVDTIPDLVELVTLGVGVSLVPPAAIRMAGGRTIGLATDPSIPRDLVLVTPLDREPSPAAVAFLELLESELQDGAQGSAPHQPAGAGY
jgi:DNA-binding transcriptional LysR family regulator